VLRKHGIDAIIVSGLVTNGCCDCAARDAFQYGYNVTVATDATAAMTDEEHNASLLNLTLYYAHTRSVDEIIAALRRFTQQGFFVEPTTAAAGAGLSRLIADGAIAPGQTTVVILTGSGLKAVDKIGTALGLAAT